MSLQRSISCALAGVVAIGTCAWGSTASAVQGSEDPVEFVVAAHAAVTTSKSVAPRAKATFAQPGKYQGHFYTDKGKRLEKFAFRVSKNGRKVKQFRATISVICSYYPPTVEVHPMGFPTTEIKKRGNVKKVWKPNKDSRILLKGKFKGKRLVSGKLDYMVGLCVRVGYLKAKRVGK